MAAIWLLQAGGAGNEFGSAGAAMDYLKMMAILAIVLAIAFAALRWWLPRMAGMRQPSAGPIRVAARLTLEPRKSLYIIEAAGDCFLVGTSDSGVHFLTAHNAERVEAMTQTPPASGRDFASLLDAFKRTKHSS